MTQFIRAHGANPGPTQRPRAAGAISGSLVAIGAIALLWACGAISGMAQALGLAQWLIVALQWLAFALAGAVYGWVFRRAADDRRGGWLFGISYGFLVWMLGPATLIDWISDRPLAVGAAALGLFGAHLVWGIALGLLFPWVHHLLQRRLSDTLTVYGRGIGH